MPGGNLHPFTCYAAAPVESDSETETKDASEPTTWYLALLRSHGARNASIVTLGGALLVGLCASDFEGRPFSLAVLAGMLAATCLTAGVLEGGAWGARLRFAASWLVYGSVFAACTAFVAARVERLSAVGLIVPSLIALVPFWASRVWVSSRALVFAVAVAALSLLTLAKSRAELAARYTVVSVSPTGAVRVDGEEVAFEELGRRVEAIPQEQRLVLSIASTRRGRDVSNDVYALLKATGRPVQLEDFSSLKD